MDQDQVFDSWTSDLHSVRCFLSVAFRHSSVVQGDRCPYCHLCKKGAFVRTDWISASKEMKNETVGSSQAELKVILSVPFSGRHSSQKWVLLSMCVLITFYISNHYSWEKVLVHGGTLESRVGSHTPVFVEIAKVKVLGCIRGWNIRKAPSINFPKETGHWHGFFMPSYRMVKVHGDHRPQKVG